MNTVNKAKSSVFRWEMWGILFIILMGALLHFTFEFSGGWRPLGVISAVNESVWEHLKLAFWPAVVWTIIEFFFVRRTGKDQSSGFILAKAIGSYVMPLVIVIIFYSYTSFTGESFLVVDLASFVIAVAIGQLVSYYLWKPSRLPNSLNSLGMALFVIGILLFITFTFWPPEIPIFLDPVSGGYGIR
jgi:hypothetical protein